MKDIKTYINESRGSWSRDEYIEVDEHGFYGYMYYDPNTGVVSTYGMNYWSDFARDYNADPVWAKELSKIKVGESITGVDGSIYTRIW